MLLTLALIFNSLFLVCLDDAQTSNDDTFEKKVECALQVEGKHGRFHLADFDLGQIPLGKTCKVPIEIRNDTGGELEIGKSTLSCMCQSFKIDSPKIQPNGLLKAELKFSTEKNAQKRKWDGTISIKDVTKNGEPSLPIVLHFSYEISGYLGIVEDLVVLEVAEGETIGEVGVGVEISDPVKLENLGIDLPDSLRDFQVEIESISGNPTLKIMVPQSLLESGPVSDQIVVKDKVTGASDSILIFAKRKPPIAISPTVTRLAKFKDDKDTKESLVGYVLIRLDRLQGEKKDDTRVSIRCTLHENPVTIETKKLSDDVYRVKIVLKNSESVQGKEELNWTIVVGGKQTELKTKVIVQN
jgi:hypothetical protein